MAFTNEICANAPSETPTPTSQRPSPTFSNATGIETPSCSFTYCSNVLHGTRAPLRCTAMPEPPYMPAQPATSYARRASSAHTSSSSSAILKRARSGLNVMHVYSAAAPFFAALAFIGVIVGLQRVPMLSRNVCL